MSDQVVNLKAVKSTELAPGFRGKFLHSERMSFVYWEINMWNVDCAVATSGWMAAFSSRTSRVSAKPSFNLSNSSSISVP
jgi:hypothetical protein